MVHAHAHLFSGTKAELPWNAPQAPRQISDSAEDQAPTGWQAAPLGSPSGRVRDDATGEVIPPEESGAGDPPGDQLADTFAAFSLDDWEYEADALEPQEDRQLVSEAAAMSASLVCLGGRKHSPLAGYA